MSTVIPNGQIRFLSGVPLDASYENSIDFTSREAQTSYFLSIQPVKTMVGATRVRDGVINVDCPSDTILTADYLMFQNTGFSNKWFYAFIKDVEYVNNNMCHVTYEIDDIQTWMFDTQLKQCFIEREHTQTDNIYEHIIDEDFNASDYVTQELERYYMRNTCVVIFTSAYVNDGELVKSVANFHEGLPSMVGTLQVHIMDEDGTIKQAGLNTIQETINDMTSEQQKDSIVAGILFPDKLTVFGGGSTDPRVAHRDTFYLPTVPSTIDGYTPKNKKMFNAPYCIYTLESTGGERVVLQPELFTGASAGTGQKTVSIYPAVSPNPSVVAVPLEYAGKIQNFEKALSYDGFPQFAMSIDGYSAWVASGGLARLAVNTMTSVTGDFIGGATSLATGNPAGVGTSATNIAGTIGNAVITGSVAKKLPNETKGSMNTTPFMANNIAQFNGCYATIKADKAKAIDDYLTMFGYKVNKIGTPSRRNRPHYTYIKTNGCKVIGGAPADAIDRIQRIYDSGIRFWVNASEVGNYNVNNAPT